MIAYLIFDKKNWIRKELYFESYEFFNFEGFFRIFLIFFGFILNLFKFKKYENIFFFIYTLMWQPTWGP